MRDPRHLRHARALAVSHRDEAAYLYELALSFDERSRNAAPHRPELPPGALEMLAWHASSLRSRALECELRALFAEDAIDKDLRDLALVLVEGWAGTLKELLASAEAVLS